MDRDHDRIQINHLIDQELCNMGNQPAKNMAKIYKNSSRWIRLSNS